MELYAPTNSSDRVCHDPTQGGQTSPSEAFPWWIIVATVSGFIILIILLLWLALRRRRRTQAVAGSAGVSFKESVYHNALYRDPAIMELQDMEAKGFQSRGEYLGHVAETDPDTFWRLSPEVQAAGAAAGAKGGNRLSWRLTEDLATFSPLVLATPEPATVSVYSAQRAASAGAQSDLGLESEFGGSAAINPLYRAPRHHAQQVENRTLPAPDRAVISVVGGGSEPRGGNVYDHPAFRPPMTSNLSYDESDVGGPAWGMRDNPAYDSGEPLYATAMDRAFESPTYESDVGGSPAPAVANPGYEPTLQRRHLYESLSWAHKPNAAGGDSASEPIYMTVAGGSGDGGYIETFPVGQGQYADRDGNHYIAIVHDFGAQDEPAYMMVKRTGDDDGGDDPAYMTVSSTPYMRVSSAAQGQDTYMTTASLNDTLRRA